MSPIYGQATKLFLESEFQHKGNKQTENTNSQQNLAVFLGGTDSENEFILILYSNGHKNFLTKLSSLGKEPTFKVFKLKFFM